MLPGHATNASIASQLSINEFFTRINETVQIKHSWNGWEEKKQKKRYPIEKLTRRTDIQFPGCEPFAMWATSWTEFPLERTSH